jgi:tRNA 2-thiouridine synthesizing protein A
VTRPDIIDPGRIAASCDTSGLLCPLPVYRASVALNALEPGQVLELVCTDPGSAADIPAFAHQRGDELLATREDGDTLRFWIEKGAPR